MAKSNYASVTILLTLPKVPLVQVGISDDEDVVVDDN